MFPKSELCHLACECAKISKLPFSPIVEHHCFCSVSKVDIDEVGSKLTGRATGSYSSIFSEELCGLDRSATTELSQKTADEIKRLCQTQSTSYNSKILVVGLGNGEVTHDSLGARVCQRLFPDERLCILPVGVSGKSGIESRDLVKSAVTCLDVQLVIAVDALAAQTEERVGRVIQLSNAGISPGSGGRGGRGYIEQKFIGVPVIAIGVPSVLSDFDLSGRGYFGVKENVLSVAVQSAAIIADAIKIFSDN